MHSNHRDLQLQPQQLRERPLGLAGRAVLGVMRLAKKPSQFLSSNFTEFQRQRDACTPRSAEALLGNEAEEGAGQRSVVEGIGELRGGESHTEQR